MQTIQQTTTFESLCQIIKSYSTNNHAALHEDIDALFSECMSGLENDSEKLLSALLIQALKLRIDPQTVNENIYLKKYEISQIQLFNILIDKFPFVKYSQQIANVAIIDAMSGCSEVSIIDIGIGQGTQIMNILARANELTELTKLTIVGIEPFTQALEIAKSNIESYRDKVPFELCFTGINDFAENIEFSKIEGLSGKIIVNASLALHHIQSDSQRTEIIARIRQVNPAAFILIEPNVNHFEPDFYSRFINCYNHFYGIFKVIDKLDISNTDKNGLKLFFGREIEDIIGKQDKDRFEKHEPATHWIDRLHKNNFSINDDFHRGSINTDTGVEIKFHKEGFLGFTVDDETILSVIYAN